MLSSNRSDQPRITFADVCDFLDQEVILFTGGHDLLGKRYFLFARTQGKWSEMPNEDYCKVIAYFIQTLNFLSSEIEVLELSLLIDARFIKPPDLKDLLARIKSYFPANLCQIIVIKPDDPIQTFKNFVSSISYTKMEQLPIKTCKSLDSLAEFFTNSQLPVDFGGSHSFDYTKWRKNQLLSEQFALSVQQLIRALASAERNYKLMPLPLRECDHLESIVHQQRVCKENLHQQVKLSEESDEAIIGCVCNKDVSDTELSPDQRLHFDIIRHVIVERQQSRIKFETFWKRHEELLSNALKLSLFCKNYQELNESFTRAQHDLQALSIFTPSDPDSVNHSFTAIQTLEELGTIRKLQSGVDQLQQSLRDIETDCFSGEWENSDKVEPSSLITLPSLNNKHTLVNLENGDNPNNWDTCWDARYVRLDDLSDLQTALSSSLSNLECDLSNCKAKLSHLRDFYQIMAKADEWCTDVKEFLSEHEEIRDMTVEMGQIQELLQNCLDLEESRSDLKEIFHPKEFRNCYGDLLTQDINSRVHDQLLEFEDIHQKLQVLHKTLSELLTEMQSKSVVNHGVDDTVSLQSSEDMDHCAASETTSIDNHSLLDEYSPNKLQRTIDELIDTERTYVLMLTTIHKTFWDAMDDPNNAEIVPKDLLEDRSAVFGNWGDIASFHKNVILPAIENGQSSLESIGDCFLSHYDQLIELYSTYCVQHTVAPLNLARLGGDEQSMIKMCRTKLDLDLPLASYLLKPVQRLQKYQLLLQQLIRHSNVDSVESPVKSALESALKVMLKVLDFVNSAMSQSDIRGYKEKLTSLGRLLLHQKFGVWFGRNTLKPNPSGAPKQRHLFLYDKAILICKQRDQGKNVYDFEKRIRTNEIGITETPNGENLRFVIWTPDKSFSILVQASNESLKAMWTRELNRLLFKQFEMLKEEKSKLHKGQE